MSPLTDSDGIRRSTKTPTHTKRKVFFTEIFTDKGIKRNCHADANKIVSINKAMIAKM